MKKIRTLCALFTLFASSCSLDPGVSELRGLYKELVKVSSSSREASAIARFVSPAIRDDKEALESLRSLLSAGYRCRIEILEPTRAVAVLSDGRDTRIPFVRDESGSWRVAEYLVATRFIEMVPAAPRGE